MSELFGSLNIFKWLRRNIYSIIIVTLTECLSAVLAYYFSRDLIISAIVASLVGNIVFFLIIFYNEVKERKSIDKKITVKSVFKVARNLLIEFGPAEYLDGFLFRPFFLVVFPMFISPYFLGVLVGSILVEFVYVLAVIFSYKSRKKLLKD
jgi:hypothetical protein